jgi:hypothetical protein
MCCRAWTQPFGQHCGVSTYGAQIGIRWGDFERNGDFSPTTPKRLAIIALVWQKFHILTRAQVFVLASVCAVVIALAVALASIPADGVSWNRFLGPSRQLDPFINFGSAFVSVLPVFLGYYHLARLGAFLGVAISALTCFTTQVCAGFIFVFQLVGRSVVLQEATYASVWMLISVLVWWMHIKASKSPAVRDAQRRLHLPDLHSPQLGQSLQGR